MCQCESYLLSTLLILVCCCNLFIVTAFNLETFNYAFLESPDPAADHPMFGFTVGIHKESNTGWVLVGAPEAQSRYQNSIYKGGVVYKCRVDADRSCEEIPFDRKGNTLFRPDEYMEGKIIDNKTLQWFGATLSTSGRERGRVVACAPRYTWFSKDFHRRDPVGTCYVSDGTFREFDEYSPCRTTNWGYHRQGLCQAGFSAAINNVGDRLFIGAPGSYFWQGQMYSIDAHATFNFTPGLYQESFGAKGSVYQQSLETRPAVFSTKEGNVRDDNSYMGYSTITGDFFDSGVEGIAVGMPRGQELRGKVLLFTWDLQNFRNFSSDQLGSYFGYSLAAADIDGDKKTDLIIGAPMYTVPNNEGKYDVGRVFVIRTTGSEKFNAPYAIDGFNSKSRFGHALASLGDINQDGFGDFAVGAPYDGAQEQGAVYIYHGSRNGVRKKYSQVIFAENVSPIGGPLRTFGFSLAGGMDLDGNEYPDMAVGAYLSNMAFFFRSRPVVRIDASVRFLTPNKQIDIKSKNCTVNGKPSTCTDINFCVKYSGKGIPQRIQLNLEYKLDTKHPKTSRMLFLDLHRNSFNETITLLIDRPQTCKSKRVYIQGEIKDKLAPLEAEVNYSILEGASYESLVRNPRSELGPILDLNTPPSAKDSIIVQKNCGNDNICIPNLHINVTSNVEKYLMGSNGNLEFDVIVSNFGEDSFETTFELQYPAGIYLKKIEPGPKMNVLCSPSHNRTIKCEIGNPLAAGKISSFRVLLQPYHEDGMAPSYEFDLYVNSTNPEDRATIDDNHKHISIDIWIDATLELRGKSYPSDVHFEFDEYPETITKETDIGPQVVHLYYLRNTGPATIQQAEMYFLWPYATTGDEDFLYLLEQPLTLGNVKCDFAPVNYKNYLLDYHSEKSIWQRLQIDTTGNEFSTGSTSEGVFTETGGGTVGVVGGGKSTSSKKLDEEISSSADGSIIHQRRQNFTVNVSQKPTTDFRTKTVESKWETKYVNGVRKTIVKNITTITDSRGKIIEQYEVNSENPDQIVTLNTAGQQFMGGQQGHFGSSSSSSSSSTFNSGVSTQQGGQHYQGQPKIVYTSSGSSNYRPNIAGNAENEPDYSVSGSTKIVDEKYPGHVFNNENNERFVWNRQGGGSSHSSGGYHSSGSAAQDGEYYRQTGGSSAGTSHQHGGGYYQQTGGSAAGTSQQHGGGYYQQTGGSAAGTSQQHGGGYYQQTGGSAVGTSNRQGGGSYEQSQSSGGTYHQSVGGGSYHQQGGGSYQQSGGSHSAGRTYQQTGGTSHQQGGASYEHSGGSQGGYHQQSGGSHHQSGGSSSSGKFEGSYQSGVSGGSSYHQAGGQHSGQSQGTSGGTGSYYYEKNVGGGGRVSNENVHSNTLEGEQSYSGEYSGERSGYFDSEGNYRAYQRSGSGVAGGTSSGEASRINSSFNIGGASVVNTQEGLGEASLGSGFRIGVLQPGSSSGISHIDIGPGSANFAGNTNNDGSGKQQWNTEYHYEQSGQIPPTYFNSIEEPGVPARDNVPTDRPNMNNRFIGRRKRQADDNGYAEISNLIQCKSTKCFYVKCLVGTLEKDKEVSVLMRSRLNVRAVQNISSSQPMRLSSMMVARISKLPYIGSPREMFLHSHEVFTFVPGPKPELKPYIVPLWIVVLSAAAGALFLLLIVVVLYKIGFFKRKRPSTAPERQPLNRNGYHHGDEAL